MSLILNHDICAPLTRWPTGKSLFAASVCLWQIESQPQPVARASWSASPEALAPR